MDESVVGLGGESVRGGYGLGDVVAEFKRSRGFLQHDGAHGEGEFLDARLEGREEVQIFFGGRGNHLATSTAKT